MMEEYVLNIIKKNLPFFEQTIGEYFGYDYYEKIHTKLDTTEFVVARGQGVCEVGGVEVYLMDEPLCVKRGEDSFIIMPLSFFNNKSCNITFAHLLLHSILGEFQNDDVSAFYETLIDYIANDMGETLKNNHANICASKDVLYESSSLYVKFFPLIEEYFANNKDLLIDSLINEDEVYLNEEEENIANDVQNSFDNYCFNIESGEENKIIKK